MKPHFLLALMSVVQTNRNRDFFGARWVILVLNCKTLLARCRVYSDVSEVGGDDGPTCSWSGKV